MAFALHLQYFQSPWARYGPVILRMSFVCCCSSLAEFTFPPSLIFHNYWKTSGSAGQKALSLQRLFFFFFFWLERAKKQGAALSTVLSVSFLSVSENWFPVENMSLQGHHVWKNKKKSRIWRVKTLITWSWESNAPILTPSKVILLGQRYSLGDRLGQGIGTSWHLRFLRWNIEIPVSGQRWFEWRKIKIQGHSVGSCRRRTNLYLTLYRSPVNYMLTLHTVYPCSSY